VEEKPRAPVLVGMRGSMKRRLYFINCDSCSASTKTHPDENLTVRQARELAKELGFTVTQDHRDLCAKCTKKEANTRK